LNKHDGDDSPQSLSGRYLQNLTYREKNAAITPEALCSAEISYHASTNFALSSWVFSRLEEEICSMFVPAPIVVCVRDPELWKY
jgi:hypothetical protein